MRKIREATSGLVDWIKWRFFTASKPQSCVTSSTSSSSSSPRARSFISRKNQGTPSSFTHLPSYYAPSGTQWQIFLDDAIPMYILPDIERLTHEIRPDSEGLKRGLRGCTIPLAMLLFAIIDLFGFLTREDKNAEKRQTGKNFEHLLSSDYFPPVYRKHWKRILKLYRHGVIHQVFPKASAIAKAGPNHPLIYVDSGFLVLNVDRLSRDVVEAINRIRTDIEQHDRQLIQRMNDRLEEIAKADQEALGELWTPL